MPQDILSKESLPLEKKEPIVHRPLRYSTTIILDTEINAPIEKCFDIARSVDVHQQSMAHTNERAIAGRTSGLCELNDEITWEAVHFGIKQQLSVKIVEFDRPHYFADTMLKGAFASMYHRHYFKQQGNKTLMQDVFLYEVPYEPIGTLFDVLVLKKYMTRLLQNRNRVIKELAESNGYE